MWRSIAAVGGGLLAMIVVVVAGTAAATAALVPGGLAAMAGPPAGGSVPRAYLAANLTLGVVAAMLGGWIAARFSPAAPFWHAAVLAAVVLLMGVASGAGGPAPGQPAWYPWTVAAIGFAGVLAGGLLATR